MYQTVNSIYVNKCTEICYARDNSVTNLSYFNILKDFFSLFFSFIFIFGLGFMKVVVLNIYIPLVLYIFLFRYQLFLDRKIRQQGITNL